MKKFVVVVSEKDKAGMNIFEKLKKVKLPKNVEVVKVGKESIDNECLDKEVEGDYFIFATKHRSESGMKSFCVHVPGNFSKAEVGGKDGELDVAMPSFMKVAVKTLNKINTLKDFEVALEVSHHGPYLEKPCMFIEIGSSEEEWEVEEAGEIVAKTILEIVENKKRFKSCIVLGGGHYNQVGKKLMLGSDWAVGHICPKYQLENLNEKMLEQMLTRTDDKVGLVVLDWKGLGRWKDKVIKLLDKNESKSKIKYERYGKLK